MSLLAEIHSLGSRPDPLSYVSFIETLASLRRTLEADALFHEVVRFMIYGSYSVRLYNALVSRYLRKEVSWRVVNEMKKRKFRLNSFVYGKIIRIYRDNGMWKKALGIVEEIREIGLPMDVEIYNSVIDTFGKYGELDEELQFGSFEDIGELVGKLKSQGVAPSANLFCTLANAYAQQGLCKQTVKVLKMMENEGIEPNLIMLNVLINAFGTAGKHMEALSIYHHIKETVWIHPDVVTYSTLMKAFTRAKKYEMVCSRNIQGNGSFWVYNRSESKTIIAKCYYGS
ncbi:Tetratricopeptide repeat (TPR)-like superfamily protein [Arabidopsis thaliana]|uniref:Tetratricopeptide repeat (TPR)-like superfamily protein n=1 Tax=Arabidopsis thaliana TaxID=3702 RepID=UPI0001A7B3D8|nr:Tetratricopeptide repeat (TPR)-like superfamily protein [Arabidopsis thaliana]AED94067.1 Tetratricopeptide repeat (TPR)-like superfamily protein [Arabidopsis thaliana]|eukprot:NP_001154751.1 Tetratricopeptide repeat (TPR)-like superfamily protein [Arabidopsis thaliana]